MSNRPTVKRVTYAAFGDVNSYLVFFDDIDKALLVDCGRSRKTVKEFCDRVGITISAVFLTHGHIDHMAEGGAWQRDGACIYISNSDAKYLNSDLNLAKRFCYPYEPYAADVLLKGDEVIDFFGHEIRVISCPGHTPGGMSYYIDGVVFTGDTLFADTVGRTDFVGGDFYELLRSVQKIIALPKDTIVYPGHGHPLSIAEIIESNPYVESLNV